MSEDVIYLGLESGGTKLVATVADADANVLATRVVRRNPQNRAPQTLADLVALGRQLLAEHAPPGAPLAAVGFGFGGTVDRSRNEPVRNLHEEGWDAGGFNRQLGEQFRAPVFCENDCKAAALAEAHRGAGSPVGVSFYCTVGSGVGGGVVHDGRILSCSPFGEAEFGHLIVEEDGPQCACGNRGCLESLCSGWGLATMASRLAPQFEADSDLAAGLKDLPRADVARRVFAAYPGDPLARACVERFCELMGRACATVMTLLTPRAIVFGGGVMHNEWLPAAIQERTRGRVPPYLRQACRFERAKLGELAVSLGAILHARSRVQQQQQQQQQPRDDR